MKSTIARNSHCEIQEQVIGHTTASEQQSYWIDLECERATPSRFFRGEKLRLFINQRSACARWSTLFGAPLKGYTGRTCSMPSSLFALVLRSPMNSARLWRPRLNTPSKLKSAASGLKFFPSCVLHAPRESVNTASDAATSCYVSRSGYIAMRVVIMVHQVRAQTPSCGITFHAAATKKHALFGAHSLS